MLRNLCIVVALIHTIFLCHAHPLRDDLGLSLGPRAGDETFLVETVKVDEKRGTAKINNKYLFLERNPVELGKNDVKGLSRKYYLYDPGHENYEVERPAILKIVDLDMAKGLGGNAQAFLMKEGEYWGKVEGNMFLWQTDEPVDLNGQRVYMVLYRPARTGVIFGHMGNLHPSEPLKFIGEWYLEWKTEVEVNYMLGQCKYVALETHKSLAEKGMEIDDYDLDKWVTDKKCKLWLPNEMNVAFNHESMVKGAKKLKLTTRSDYEAHFRHVKKELDLVITQASVKGQLERLSKIKAVELMRPGQ